MKLYPVYWAVIIVVFLCLFGWLGFLIFGDTPPHQLPRKGQRLPVVQPGAFCSSPGARGATNSGALMICKPSDTDTRDRWRAA